MAHATLALGRTAAVVLVLTLSGAAGFVPRASDTGHHCECQMMAVAGHRVLVCPMCRLAALRAAAFDRTASRTERATALRALEQELERPENGGAPCWSSGCGSSRGAMVASGSTGPFTLPRAPGLVRRLTSEGVEVVEADPAPWALVPEIPPPRSI